MKRSAAEAQTYQRLSGEIEDQFIEANPYVNSAGWRLGRGSPREQKKSTSSMSNSNLEQEPEPEDSRNNTIFETRDSLIVDQEDNSRNMSR